MKTYIIFALFVGILLHGCASAPRIEKPILYPRAPEEPRVVYLKSYTGPLDFRVPSFLDALFGAPSGGIFTKPYGVTAHNGTIYVADSGGAAVVVVDTKQKEYRAIFGTEDEGSLVSPMGVTVSDDGLLFVADVRLKQILIYKENGEYINTIGAKGDFNALGGIAVNSELGRIYVPDSYNSCVYVYSVKGQRLFTFGQLGEGDGDFRRPSNVAVDRRNGNVYVADTQNFRVQVFDKDGKYLRRFGELGDTPGTFSRPKGIGIDSEGHIYVADAAFDNFQIFDEDGNLLLFVGSAGQGPGQFSLPAGLYVDEHDMIYVVDSMNRRVNVFQYLSEKWKKEHPEEYKKYLQEPGRSDADKSDGKKTDSK